MDCNKCFFTNPVDRMKLIRLVLRLKQDTFCKYMNISQPTLYLWENKSLRLSQKQKDRLKYVGINSQWIEYGSGQPFFLNQNTVANNIINFKP